MSRYRLTFSRALATTVTATAAVALWPAYAKAQACCAGANAVTPARLAPYEDALVGTTLRISDMFGNFDANGNFAAAPAGVRELDVEQDFFGAVRPLPRAQLAVLIPWVETYRKTRTMSEVGGGLGDVNLALRYDFTLARAHRYLPGVAGLLGLTLPTGTAVEDARKPLATDATGVGAYQVTAGVAIEQIFGSWLIGVSGWASKRTARTTHSIHYELSPQYSALASVAYVFESAAALAVFFSYTGEGNTTINDVEIAQSSHRLMQAAVAGVYPMSDQLHLMASLYLDPPVSHLSVNQPAAVGCLVGLTWSLL